MYRTIIAVILLLLSFLNCHAATLECVGTGKAAATYRADSGADLNACFDLERKTVTLGLADGSKVTLPVAISGSGARYSDGTRTFWEHKGVGRYFVDEKLLFEGGTATDSVYKSGVKTQLLLKTGRTADGSKIAYPVTDNPEVTVMLVEIPPNTETGWHKHLSPVYGYMLSGEIEVSLKDDRKFLYKTGDPVIEVVGVLHNGINRGGETAKLVVFYIGTNK